MAVVTELTIDGTGATRGAEEYSRAMDRAQQAMHRSLGAMSNDVRGAGENITQFVGILSTLAAGGVIGGVITWMSKLSSELAGFETTAKRAGLALSDFQALRGAAALKGIGGADFDTGITKMAKALNEARREETDLSKLLDLNNVKFKEGTNLVISTNRALEIAADLIKRASSDQDKVKIAKAFGLDEDFVTLLEGGAGGLRQLANEARQAGAVISDDVIHRAAEFDREWTRAVTTWTLRVKAAAIEAIEDLKGVIRQGQDTQAAGIPLLPKNIGVAATIEFLKADWADFTGQLSQKWQSFITVLEKVPGLEGLRRELETIPPLITHAAAEADRLRSSLSRLSLPTAEELIPTPRARPANAPGATLIPTTDETKNAFDRQIDSIHKHIAAMKADAESVGMGAAAHEAFRAQLILEEAAGRDGIGLTKERLKLIAEEVGKVRAAAQAKAEAQISNQIGRDRQFAFMTPEDVQIAERLKSIYPDIATALNSGEAAAMRLTNTMKGINDALGTALGGIGKDIANGVKPMDALVNAAKNLQGTLIDMAAKKLASAALSGLFGSVGETAGMTAGATSAAAVLTTAGTTVAASMIAGATEAAGILGLTVPEAAAALPIAGAVTGTEVAVGGEAGGAALALGGAAAGAAIWGPIALLVAAVAAIGFAIGGGSDKKDKLEEERKKREEASNQRIDELRQRRALVGIDTGTLQGALTDFDLRANTERQRAGREGALSFQNGKVINQELIETEATLAVEREAIIKKFADDAVAAEKKRVDDIKQIRADLADREFAAANDNSTMQGKLLEFDRASIRERERLEKDFAETLPDFDRTRLGERAALEKQFADEARQRQQGFRDSLFLLVQDQTTLEGQLAAFELQAQRQRQDEIKSGGEAIVELQALQEQQRLNIIKDFNDKAIEEQKRVVEEANNFFTQLRRNIREFIDGLRAGASSPLSPAARLAAAQAQYNQQLALAHGGNRDALSGITRYGSDLIEASRAYFGSGGPFQTTFNQVIAQLEALPTIAQTTDPTIAAIEDTTAAIQDQTVVAQAQKALLDLIKQSNDTTATQITATKNLVDTGNALQVTSNALATTANFIAGTQQTLLESINNLLGAINTGTVQSITNTQLLVNNIAATAPYTRATAWNTSRAAQSSGNVAGIRWGFEQLAGGGIIPPFGLALVSEHSPGGGRFLRAGPEPITVTPNAPSNDNGPGIQGLASAIRAMHADVARLLAAIANTSARGDTMLADAIQQSGRRQENKARHQSEKPKAA